MIVYAMKKKCDFDIDLVYLGVDGSDPVWLAKKNAVCGAVISDAATNGVGRYVDNDELKYSLRSIECYAPWVRKIFIVTDSQIPKWLDTSNPRIKIVDHKEIIPGQYLPCFNSSVIEHFICKIPGLSEHFLYANDDMFINRCVSPEDFFASDGFPVVRHNRRLFRKFTLWMREKVLRKGMSHYNRIVNNAAVLVKEKYGVFVGSKAHHNIDSYLKSDCCKVEEMFADALIPTFINHVRRYNDIQRSLYHYVALVEHRCHLKYVDQKSSLRLHNHEPNHFERLEKYKPLFFCINDSQYADDEDRRSATRFLAGRFPEKSTFEILSNRP